MTARASLFAVNDTDLLVQTDSWASRQAFARWWMDVGERSYRAWLEMETDRAPWGEPDHEED